MLLLWGVVAGMVIGFLRGGSVANLGKLNFNRVWLIPLALILQAQLLLFPLFFASDTLPILSPEFFHVLSYLVLAFFVTSNWNTWQIPFMGVGMAFNLSVIGLNGGYMPASIPSLIRAGDLRAAYYLTQEETYGNVITMSKATVLDFFGDWLYLPDWLPFSTAFSPGDAIIAVGLVMFFGLEMVSETEDQ